MLNMADEFVLNFNKAIDLFTNRPYRVERYCREQLRLYLDKQSRLVDVFVSSMNKYRLELLHFMCEDSKIKLVNKSRDYHDFKFHLVLYDRINDRVYDPFLMYYGCTLKEWEGYTHIRLKNDNFKTYVYKRSRDFLSVIR